MHLEVETIHHPQIKNMNLTVTDISYKAPHLHPEIELVLVLKGAPSFNIDGTLTQFTQKSIVLINTNELHEIISEEQTSTLLSLHILPEYFEGYFPQMKFIRFHENKLTSKNNHLFIYTFCKLLKTYISQEPYYQIHCSSLINIMIYDILENCAYYEMHGNKLKTNTKRNQQLSEIIFYIEKHYAEKITLTDLSRHLNLSPSYLSHFIQDNLHRSFSEFLTYTRYLNAKSLLMKGELTLTDICYSCGFSSYRYMNNAFKKYSHYTPNEFKRKMSSKLVPSSKKGTVINYPPEQMLSITTQFMIDNNFNEFTI